MEYKLYILIGKGRGGSFKLEPTREYTVGRHPDNDIKILDANISRNHFKIKIKGSKYYITDLHSKNGTFVDGIDLIPGMETEIKEGVPILIGMTILGLGEMSELRLKQFLDSAGFRFESNEYEEIIEKQRGMALKKNLQFIYNVTNSLNDSKDAKEIAEKLLDNIFDLLKRIDRGVIILVDDETGKMNNIIYRSRIPVKDPEKVYNRELVERALLINQPVMFHDSNNMEDEDEKITASLQFMKIRSALCVPIVGCDGIRGAIYVDSLEMPNGFRVNDAFILKDVSARAALAMDNISQEMSRNP